MKLQALVVSLLISLAATSEVELCQLSRVWGDTSYENKDNCKVVNLNLTAHSLTVSGFSSGAVMTATLFSMFADNIDGAAMNSGYFTPCVFLRNCSAWDHNTEGMKGKPMYFYRGTKDTSVSQWMNDDSFNTFKERGVNYKTNFINDFVHVLPNNVQVNNQYNPPTSCAQFLLTSTFSQNCGFNNPFEVLSHLFKDEMTKDENFEAKDEEYQAHGTLWAINQTAFDLNGTGKLAEQGFLYVPDVCFNESCRFHVDFHGCNQSIKVYDDKFIRSAGYLEYAASSKMIVLFPQNGDPNAQFMPYCWDGAYSSDRDHPQIKAIGQMVKSLFNRDLLRDGVEPSLKPLANLNTIDQAEDEAFLSMMARQTISNTLKLSNPFKFFNNYLNL